MEWSAVKSLGVAMLAGMTWISSASLARAASLEEADALFAKREDGRAAIDAARQMYTGLLPGLQGARLVHAVEKIARLEMYEGLRFFENDAPQRKIIFDRCMQTVDKMGPTTTAGRTPNFFYWKAACHAQWARANGITESLFRTRELLRYLDDGQAVDASYEGGGFYRIRGAVYQKLPPFNPLGPTKDLAKSKAQLELSIASPAWSRSPTPETDTGDYYFESYVFLAETLIEMRDRSTANREIDAAIGRIESGDLSPARAPEARLALEKLRALRARIAADAALD